METTKTDVIDGWLECRMLDHRDRNLDAAHHHMPAAIAALKSVTERHKPVSVWGLGGACAAEDCEHEATEECDKVELHICVACSDLAEKVTPYWDEGAGWRVAEWPCDDWKAVATALGAEAGETE